MSKAYDCVEWKFLEDMMMKMGFRRRWLELIMNCVTTVSYRIKINSALSENFKPESGLRQGDPLSAYFFFLRGNSDFHYWEDAESSAIKEIT
jgi:hypothetical protein